MCSIVINYFTEPDLRIKLLPNGAAVWDVKPCLIPIETLEMDCYSDWYYLRPDTKKCVKPFYENRNTSEKSNSNSSLHNNVYTIYACICGLLSQP